MEEKEKDNFEIVKELLDTKQYTSLRQKMAKRQW